jgi:hypothetical protein
MASPSVVIDSFNPLIQHLLATFEQTYLPDDGLEGEERAIKREYIRGARIAFVRSLMERVLSGDWNWGTTQREIGEELGLDRSRLSDALRKGEMSMDTFVAIWFANSKPYPRFAGEDFYAVNGMIRRGGFIGAAKHLAGLVHGRDILDPSELNELRHEILCAIFNNYLLWNKARISRCELVAADLVERVYHDKALRITPGWYTAEQKSQVDALVSTLRANPSTAMQFLSRLQDAWEDIYVATAQTVETFELEF